MILKIKLWDWSAGLPVAMLNKKTAEALSVHPEDRISIKTTEKKGKEVSTLIDVINGKGFVKEGEIAISSELKQYFDLREGQRVEVNPSNLPDSLVFGRPLLVARHVGDVEGAELHEGTRVHQLSEAEIAL